MNYAKHTTPAFKHTIEAHPATNGPARPIKKGGVTVGWAVRLNEGWTYTGNIHHLWLEGRRVLLGDTLENIWAKFKDVTKA